MNEGGKGEKRKVFICVYFVELMKRKVVVDLEKEVIEISSDEEVETSNSTNEANAFTKLMKRSKKGKNLDHEVDMRRYFISLFS